MPNSLHAVNKYFVFVLKARQRTQHTHKGCLLCSYARLNHTYTSKAKGRDAALAAKNAVAKAKLEKAEEIRLRAMGEQRV